MFLLTISRLCLHFRAHIQRYINEVKRIEELLALRERERSELLEQYKCLTDEAETAAKNGRRMETKVRY